MLALVARMQLRTLLFTTVAVLCHTVVMGQALTNALPLSQSGTQDASPSPSTAASLPDDPGQEAMPVAQPESAPAAGVPFRVAADRQDYAAGVWTGVGNVEIDYRDYVIRADKIVYNRTTTELEAEGHLHVTGGPDYIDITASRGDMRLNTHTARFFDVMGTLGTRGARTVVYSTANPFILRARVLLQTGERSFRIVDGAMTNCRLPRPDWELLAHSINVRDGQASTTNTWFRFLGVPLFYLPYLRHPAEESGRETGFLIPVVSNGSSIRGYTLGEQVYWAINRSTDMVIGSEYYSRRGWAPNGDFRYKGVDLNHATVRWNSLFDRGFEQLQTSGPQAGQTILVKQGGADILAAGRRDFSPWTRVAGTAEFLSSYAYRLVFNDNYWQATNSEVKSEVAWSRERNGFVPAVDAARFQAFASSASGDEVRILHLPSLRFDILDRPLGDSMSPVYGGLGSSLSYLGRSEPHFHARNVGRIDLYPHVSLPLVGGGWSFVPEGALRATFYSGSQVPDLTGVRGGTPAISHDPLHRFYGEASLDLRPPALQRDFTLTRWNRQLRHVIEPELTYRFVGGIGSSERDVLLVDTTDIATNTNELGFSLTQRFYLRPTVEKSCAAPGGDCPERPREWASWQIAQKYFLDPNFGGALIPGRRNVFTSTLDLSGIAFLTDPRNLTPIASRLRFEGIDNLHIEWDLDYDPRLGRIGADNIFAAYSWGITTVGIGHSLLNAVNQQGSAATLIQTQQLEPYLQIGRQTRTGFNLAANGGYDFVHGALQYGGAQAVYNWNCCGLTVGYRRFALGEVRNETQYLYSFTLANFGAVGDIRRSNSVFRDPTTIPAY
jgi:LPS-assembly protein